MSKIELNNEAPKTKAPTIVPQIRVTNKNTFDIKDMHDSVEYEFPKGESITIPYDAACHMFGVDKDEKDAFHYIVRRRGWNTSKHQDDGTDRKYFGNLYFEVVKYEIREVARQVRDKDDKKDAAA